MKPTAYLAGAISGLTFAGANDWRADVTEALYEVGIKALSPLRCKEYLSKVGTITGHGREYDGMNVLSNSRGVMTRDRFDATRCSVLFVNLLGATSASIGTSMEIAWADLSRIPIVCAIERDGNPMDHMMINEAIGFRVHSLVDAVEVTKAILL